MPKVVVERTLPEPMTLEVARALFEAGESCLELHNVTFLRSYISADGLRMICTYDAPDAESVRLSQSGAPFDRVWSADAFMAPDAAE